jgi:hypothetical protein
MTQHAQVIDAAWGLLQEFATAFLGELGLVVLHQRNDLRQAVFSFS